jgi:hypothetical protein
LLEAALGDGERTLIVVYQGADGRTQLSPLTSINWYER